MSRRSLAVVPLASLLLAAGCGGDGTETTAAPDRGGKLDKTATVPVAKRSGERLSPRVFRRKVRTVCTDAAREMQRAAAALADPDVLFERVLEVARRSQRRAERLSPPRSLSLLHRRSLAEGEFTLELIEELIVDYRSGADPLAASREFMRELRPLIRSSKEVARKMGVPECAQAPATSPQES